MGSRDDASGSSEANPASSETERHPDTFQYDNDEELILLQMADDDDDIPSPGLKAAMDKSQRSSKPVGQSTPAPLFIERPQSSGIDVTTFCFAKPAAKNFSVKRAKPSAKQPPTQEMMENEICETSLPNKQKAAKTE